MIFTDNYKTTPKSIIRDFYNRYSPNSNGDLTKKQMETLLNDMGIKGKDDKKYIPSLLKLIDSNANDVISFDEFCNFWRKGYFFYLQNLSKQGVKERIDSVYQYFNLIDKDKSGIITIEEIPLLIESLKKGGLVEKNIDINTFLKEIDTDGSGDINFEELLIYLDKKQNGFFKNVK